MTRNPEATHFGYRTVPLDQKTGQVRELFAGVSSRYDLMNDLMSARLHRVWKTALIDWMAPRPGQEILDLAGGTGDIAFRILDRQPAARVTVLDLTEEMMSAGRRREVEDRPEAAISWIVGDAGNLPFADGSFNICTVAFGVRNFAEIPPALTEIFRVLAIGGRLLVLEFGQVRNAFLQELYDQYSFSVIPKIGQVVAGDRDSYRYLVESIRLFPDRRRFAAMFEEAGFSNVAIRDMAQGVVSIHSGWKI